MAIWSKANSTERYAPSRPEALPGLMEFLPGAIVLALIVWAVIGRGRQQDSTGGHNGAVSTPLRSDIERSIQRDFGRSSEAPNLQPVQPKPSVDHAPPSPAGTGQGAWSPRTKQLEVAGEWYRAKNLRKLFTKHAKLSELGTEILLPATLVPDPTNPFDARAVAVFVDGLHVGYME